VTAERGWRPGAQRPGAVGSVEIVADSPAVAVDAALAFGPGRRPGFAVMITRLVTGSRAAAGARPCLMGCGVIWAD
jgi:hypothetical protein